MMDSPHLVDPARRPLLEAWPTTTTRPEPGETVATPSFLRALGPLLALGVALAMGFTIMGSFSTVQEGAKAEMGLSDGVLGLIQGLAAAIPLVILSIPIGLLVDRTHRVRLVIGLSVVWTIGTLLTAVAHSVSLLFVARMLAGIGTTGALTAILSLAADLCPPTQRGRGLLIVTLGQRLGIGAAFALAGWLFGLFVNHHMPAWFGAAAPWRSVHYILAGLSAVVILPLFLLREPPRSEIVAGPQAPFRMVAAELWSRRRFLAPLFAGQVTVVMADAAAAIWVAPVLSRNYGLHPQDFAGWLGAIIFVTGIVGIVLGGISADLGQKSGKRGGLLLGAVIAAGIGIPAALFPLSPGIPLFAVAIGALILCGALTGIATAVALTVLIPNELRGLCIGAFIAIAGLIGFGIAPPMVTLVSTLLGGEQHLALALAIVGTAVSILSFFAFLLAMKRAPLSATDEGPIR
jgi:MFS family permease